MLPADTIEASIREAVFFNQGSQGFKGIGLYLPQSSPPLDFFTLLTILTIPAITPPISAPGSPKNMTPSMKLSKKP